MHLQDTLNLLPGDQVVITKQSRTAGGDYAASLIQHLKDDRPYFVDRVDSHTHLETIKETKEQREVVDRANIFIKGYAGLRLNPACFEKVEEE